MTGDPDENEDILGFGAADRGRLYSRSARLRSRLDRLRSRLDRLTLRATRRPRLLAIASGLAVVALVAGAVAYLAPSHATSRQAAAPTGKTSSQCAAAAQSKRVASEVAALLKQLDKNPGTKSSAYSSTITIKSGSASVTSTGTGAITATVPGFCGTSRITVSGDPGQP